MIAIEDHNPHEGDAGLQLIEADGRLYCSVKWPREKPVPGVVLYNGSAFVLSAGRVDRYILASYLEAGCIAARANPDETTKSTRST